MEAGPMADVRGPLLTGLRHSLAVKVHPVDVAISLGLAAISLLPYVSGASDVGPPSTLTVFLLLLESLPLIVRRRYPLESMLIVVSATIVQIGILPAGAVLQSGLGILVATYTIGERLDRRLSLGLTALTAVLVAILFVGHAGLLDALQSLIQTELILGVAWLLGDASRIRRLYTVALEERAELEEREREERTRRAIVEERERIARELHDIVTHHVSVIVIQAGGGSRAIDRRPEEARSAFEVIARTGRQALSDMRRMLGILGEREREGNDPMPGLESLDGLLAEVRAAGLPVELTVHGQVRPLDPGLELSAYRIIQESLTNSLRHARGGSAQVTVRYAPAGLDIAIDDERGPGMAPAVEAEHEGRGLVGMRERVAMFRGTFQAQPTPTGFRVTAHLPADQAIPAS
jgi:signal transduction histidine kinase